MDKIPIILDCDTGVDDAIAIMLANRIAKFDLLGITTVAGNVEVEKTTLNTLRVLELIDTDTPVHKGAAGPLVGDQITAKMVHGDDGLGGISLPLHRSEITKIAAWDAIYGEAIKRDGTLELIAVGPLTNLAMAFIKYRDLPKHINRIVIMGGSAAGGNVTPAAEFNIYADPEAADIVFSSGVPVHMCGLDVTMQAYYTPDDLEHVAALGSKPARFFRDVMQGVLSFCLDLGQQGVSMHDPLTVFYAADDSIFTTHHVGIRVETKGLLTRGKTVTDLHSDKKMERNAYIVTDVDREVFQQRVYELMAGYE
jgi:pyrimidine-specific ribonucleoside hydrolase